MNYDIRNAAKNFSSIMGAQVIYKVLTFVVMLLVARFLGPEDFGKLSYAISFVWIFLFICDFGFSEIFVRDASQDRSIAVKYANNILTLKLVIGVTVYVLICALAVMSSLAREKFWLVLIMGASVELDSFMYFFRCIFRVNGTMEYEGALMVLEAVLKMAVVLFAVYAGMPVSGVLLVAGALLLVSLINVVLNLWAFVINLKGVAFGFDKGLCRYLLRSSLPFALVYILSLLNFRVDIIMLSLMKGDTPAGWYNVVFKLIEQGILIPITLGAVYLPVFSRSAGSFKSLDSMAKKTIAISASAGILVTGLFLIVGAPAVKVIYGDKFIEACGYIRILSLVLLPFFIKPIVEKLLYAMKEQNKVFAIYSAGILMNIALNMIMIPKWGVNGASIATFLSEAAIVAASILLYMKIRKDFEGKKVVLEVDEGFISGEATY